MPKFRRETGLFSRHDSAVLYENLVMNKVGCIRRRTSIARIAVLALSSPPSRYGGSSSPNLPTSRSESGSAITSFAATPLAVAAGSTVELRWNVSNSSCLIVSPARSGPRNPRRYCSHPGDNLHSLRNEPIWPDHLTVIATVHEWLGAFAPGRE
jgi:hypothetical protein